MIHIIDSHVHVTINGKWMDTNKDSSLTKLLSEMKIASVNKAILIAIEGMIPNDYIYKIYSENKKIFYPICSVNPLSTSFKDFMEIVENGNFIGVKIHPRLHNYSLVDEKVVKFFKKVESIPNFFVLLDCWFSEYDDYSQIEETIKFINSFSNLKLILAHAGGFHYDSIVPLSVKANIFIDLSYTPITLKKFNQEKFNDFFLELRKVNTSKLIFGSDFPEVSIKRSVDILVQSFDKYGFSKEDQEKIFSKNIEMLLDNLDSEIKNG